MSTKQIPELAVFPIKRRKTLADVNFFTRMSDKIKIAALVFLAVMTCGLPTTSQALDAEVDVIADPSWVLFISAVMPVLGEENTLLPQLISAYGVDDLAGGSSGGWMYTLEAAQVADLDKILAASQQNSANASQINAQLAAQTLTAQQQIQHMPNGASCGKMAYNYIRSAGANGTASSKMSYDQDLRTRGDNAKPATPEAALGLVNHIKLSDGVSFCTPGQIQNNMGRCLDQGSSASVYLPDADAHAGSMFQGAVGTNSGGTPINGTATNHSLGGNPSVAGNKDQPKAASQYANLMTLPTPPEMLKSTVTNTPQGTLYNGWRQAYMSRVSAAQEALTSIIAFQTANNSPDVQAYWQSHVTAAQYNQVFPVALYPTTPSEDDVLQYDIASNYMDYSLGSLASKTSTTDESMKELISLEATATYLQYKQFELEKRDSAMLAAILAQQMSPITDDKLHSLATLAAQGQQQKATGG